MCSNCVSENRPYVMTAERISLYGEDFCAECGQPILAGEIAVDVDLPDGEIRSYHDACTEREADSD